MSKKITKEKFWEIYQTLPKNLQKVIFSEKTAENIYNICEKNRIKKDDIPKVASFVSQVLMKILAMENLQETIKKELQLEKETAVKINQEINQLIFDPVKDSLTEISNEKTLPKKEIKSEDLRKPTYPEGEDTYREPVE